MRRAAALAFALCLPAAAAAAPRWTFCVAAAEGGADVWVSEVFAADTSRERLEGAFRSTVERLGVSGADVQCPQPLDDRTDAINAQTTAESFNRRMGARLHAVSAGDFPAGRHEASHEPAAHSRRAGVKPHDDQPIGSSVKTSRAGE